MASLRDLPVRVKLTGIVMGTTGASLLLASTAFIMWDSVRYRREMTMDLATLADMIANNSTAALAFSDQGAAREILSAVRVHPNIRAAAVYGADGKPFAEYRAGPNAGQIPDSAGPPGLSANWTEISVFRPIALKQKTVGTVYLRSDLGRFYARVQLQAVTMAMLFVLACIAALLLSAPLQRLISGPILHMAGVARQISVSRDYSIRARKESSDELGLLVEAFNKMLAQIQEKDASLHRANEELELRVEDRTMELQQELAERRKTEQELARRNMELDMSNRELDAFAYLASHDLKEPLRGIHNYSAFLLEDYGARLDAEGKAKLETLKRLSSRMENLIESLLHYSRVGRVDLALEPVDLNEVVADVLESLRISIDEFRVQVRIPRELPTVLCDRVRVAEIYRNLVTNAIKYNDKEERWVEIGYCTGAEITDGARFDGNRPLASETMVFFVRDNGIGIQEKHYDAVFRMFKRLHAREKFGGGTGIGLAITRRVIERHGGRIWLESTYGQGATFYFTMGDDG